MVAPRPPCSTGQPRQVQPPPASTFSQRRRTSKPKVSSPEPPRPPSSANSPTRCSPRKARTSWRNATSSGRSRRSIAGERSQAGVPDLTGRQMRAAAPATPGPAAPPAWNTGRTHTTARAECQREGGRHALLPGPDRPRRRRPHHGDADLAAGPRRGGLPGPPARPALPGRERAAPDRRPGRPAARPRRRLRRAAGAARLARVPGRRGGRDHGAQELRRHRLLHRRGPWPRPRSPRVLEPARLQHVPQRAPARHGARRRRPGLRRRPRPQPGHARVLRGGPAPAALPLRPAGRSGRAPSPPPRRPWPRARPPC